MGMLHLEPEGPTVDAMPYRTIYIRKSDEVYWEWAEAQAKRMGVALTAYISQTLKNYMFDVGSRQVIQQTPIELVTEARSTLDRALAGFVAAQEAAEAAAQEEAEVS